ncbi:hypothetical protein DNTS_027186 [Danionella cerebrum]|uniref:Uncharacterized protein n=1 Tax=Danionella cerebrum TaxID=2873325 RepID=A0A553N2Y6_9TELE|nr:hypothetical protein DNTS_027186 [Danionella translucida]
MSSQRKFGVKSEPSEEVKEEEYVTPNTYELEKLFTHGSVAYTHVNEVWPNVYIGNELREHRPLIFSDSSTYLTGQYDICDLDLAANLQDPVINMTEHPQGMLM